MRGFTSIIISASLLIVMVLNGGEKSIKTFPGECTRHDTVCANDVTPGHTVSPRRDTLITGLVGVVHHCVVCHSNWCPCPVLNVKAVSVDVTVTESFI